MKTYIGTSRMRMNIRIKIRTLLYFLPLLISGDMGINHFFRFVKRLLYFLSKMKDNKYVQTGKGIKINLYVPAFPSRAFFQACLKVSEFKEKMPAVTVLMSVTSACRFNCRHCYQKLDKGKDIDIQLLIGVAKYLQDRGMGFFNIEGGEPFLVFERLYKLVESIDNRSEILINSTGDGITPARLKILKRNGNLSGIMFSLHTYQPHQLNAFMGSEDAWTTLERGIEACHWVKVPVMFNSCLSRDDYYNGTFEKVMETAWSFGAVMIQVIKPKPAGGWLDSGADHFTSQDLALVREKLISYNNLKAFKQYPAIAPMIIDEDREHFGCTAGGTDRFYINAKGDVQPCEFLNISFGNIATEPFEPIYERMRATFATPGDCWLCEKYSSGIAALFRESNLSSLPLTPELSKNITSRMEQGDIPEFYENVVKI
ncbi:MAG: radical SAM protein [Bacteroidia bacterium]|nr:radical SAM protein [Bacteroidia bacterium]